MINDKINFTVAICTRNRPKQMASLLSNLKKQTLPPNQYIFVENINEQQSLSHKIIFSVLKHPHIKYLTTTGNKAVSQNMCLDTATSNPIIYIDDDIHLEPNTFKKILQAYLDYPNASGFSTRTIHTHFKSYSKFLDYWYNPGVLHNRKPLPRPLSPTTVLCLNINRLKSSSIRFNENIYFSEDLDLFCQLQTHHLPIYYLPQITTQHQFGNRRLLSQFLKRFYQYGFDTMIVTTKYPKLINYNWLFPSRKLHYIFFPVFFIKNIFQQIHDFAKTNSPFPLSLYPITFLVFFSFDIGIYHSSSKVARS